MEPALGAANWFLGQVLNKLSDDLVRAYVSSTELGPNLDKIEREMLYTRALLDAAQGRDVARNAGLQGLLEMLGKKADEAEDALDELHYFMIQDKLDGTRHATPELGDGLAAQAQHVRHAARHTSGLCFIIMLRIVQDHKREQAWVMENFRKERQWDILDDDGLAPKFEYLKKERPFSNPGASRKYQEGLTIVDNKTSSIIEETKEIQIRRKPASPSSYMPNSAVHIHAPHS